VVVNAMWGGQPHTFYIEFWAADPDYGQLIDQVNAVIASIKLPDGVTAAP
jgi:hypothetical protein